MKLRYILFFAILFIPMATAIAGVYPDAYGVCKYYACGPGRYFTGASCIVCPEITYSSSNDRNTKGITACFIPGHTIMSDETGTYTFEDDCYYTE